MNKPSHILVLDTDPSRRDGLVTALKGSGHLPVVVGDLTEAAKALAVPGLDAALVSLAAPGLDQTLLREALAPGEPTEPEPLDNVERRHIARTLSYTRGNKRRAAHLLGIARSTLLAKVRKYGLDGGSNGE
ncbi:MAG TPA: helix-turn-helix domain-containing protein [Gemmatimonadales bacterium]|jgi:DNA-binding NtrC family response regulator|nr:helix-turn-helix domain-containing protein [Gemmatimonadales bacterium]